jgi:glycosyltransferase involved in cell wall biosynthesis
VPAARVLLVYSRPARFVLIDGDLLRERFAVRELTGTVAGPLATLRGVLRADVVVCWFASWHAVLPLALATLLRRPSLLIVGGFDTANIPEIGYGYQQGGPRRLVARWCMARATRLMTNSEYSRAEVRANTGFEAEVVHHGIPDPFGEPPRADRDALALTVSNVARISVERKGLRPFVEAGAHAPDVEFVLVGAALDGTAEHLRSVAPRNVRLTGHVEDEELYALYRRAGAYVQASRHEGFGMALAEAMLAGCVPVATRAGALPEVIGGAPAAWLDAPDPEQIAVGVRTAIAAGPAERRAVRERILDAFPLEVRREGLLRLVDELLAGRDRRA